MKGIASYIHAFLLAALLHAALAAGLGRVVRLGSARADGAPEPRSMEVGLILTPAGVKEPVRKMPEEPAPVRAAVLPDRTAPAEPPPQPRKGPDPEQEADSKPAEPDQPPADGAEAGGAAPPPAAARESSSAEAAGAARPSGRSARSAFEKPVALEPIEPLYPLGSRLRGEEGTVRLQVQVDARGRVSQVAVIASSGYPQLDRAAEKAVQRTPFSPARETSRPALVIAVHFRLDG